MKLFYFVLHVAIFSFFLLVSCFSGKVHAQQKGDYLEMAKAAMNKNEYGKAASFIDAFLKEKPNNGKAAYLSGKCKIELDNFNEALDNFTQASNLDPQEPSYYFYKGMCEWKLKRLQSAINSIEKSLIYKPDNFMAYKVLGSIYYELNLPMEAKNYFDKAIKIQPDFTSGGGNKFNEEDNAEAFNTTMRISNREIKINPNNSLSFFYKAILKTISNDKLGAYADYTKCIQINPELELTYYYKAYVEFNIKKLKEALEDLHKYSKKFPKDESAKKLLKSIEENNNVKVMEGANSEEILFIAEQMPEFEGGIQAMNKFISRNVQYPKEAFETRIQGRVIVAFVIDTVGNIRNMEILQGIGGGCEEEARRVVKMMPKWKPGRQNGKYASVRYVLPVKFALSE